MSAGPRSKSDRYRVILWENDPDISPNSHTSRQLDEAWKYVTGDSYIDFTTGQRVERVRPIDLRANIATIFCIAGCGPDRASGERLASIWRTPMGFLYVAQIVLAHDAVPSFEQLHDDALIMWHPELGQSSASWTTRAALDNVWGDKGWREAPKGLVPSREWRQQHAQRIRDLLDVQDIEHPPLRVKCTRHGAAILDRSTLLSELARRQREHDAGRPIAMSLASLARSTV